MGDPFVIGLKRLHNGIDELFSAIRKLKNEHYQYLKKNLLMEKFSEAEYSLIRCSTIMKDLINAEEKGLNYDD